MEALILTVLFTNVLQGTYVINMGLFLLVIYVFLLSLFQLDVPFAALMLLLSGIYQMNPFYPLVEGGSRKRV